MPDVKNFWRPLALIGGLFLVFYYFPLDWLSFDGPIFEALALSQWYAREHVILCLVPAFFIAGAIGVFVSQGSVMKYLGPSANKVISYGVASVSGSILAVCSCTILPLFAGIYRMGAGIGPASAFLYAGPAVNVLAIILTARVLGMEMGIARAIGAVGFSVVIGLLMHFFFSKDDAKTPPPMYQPDKQTSRSLWQTIIYFAAMIAILVFANWGKPQETSGLWATIHQSKWLLTGLSGLVLAVVLIGWFKIEWWKVAAATLLVGVLSTVLPDQPQMAFAVGFIGLSIILITDRGEKAEWFDQSWGFAKQILPLLLAGVLVAGLLLGRPGHRGIIPPEWIAGLVGGNSVGANLFASVVGAFMYFATLTEVPILQGLIGSGMGKGPALALLLAGPALSLPNMLVIRSIIGTKKTVVYVALVIIMATISGLIYGIL